MSLKQESIAFKQFLADVLTASGLVSHGKQCKALSNRLAERVMYYYANNAELILEKPLDLTPRTPEEQIKAKAYVESLKHLGGNSGNNE